MINEHPQKCNICGGKVVLTDNYKVNKFVLHGSGKSYVCLRCGARVGTHPKQPDRALGILATPKMARERIACHKIFNKLWQKKPHAKKKKSKAYKELSVILGIPMQDCHFAYFDMEMLLKAHEAVSKMSYRRSHARRIKK